MSSYISKMVKKVNSRMKANFFDPSDSVFIVGFIATFKLVGDTSRIHEGAAMRVLPFIVKNALATTLNSRMVTATHIAFVVASVNTVKPTTQQKLLRSYAEIVNYLLKKLTSKKKKSPERTLQFCATYIWRT